MIFKVFLLCSFAISIGYSKLVLVHTLFRHAERTTDKTFMYPNDPYRNETFYPYGYGQLTNKGKKTMYELGSTLRKRYSDFLGDIYLPDIVDPWASSLSRTQTALQILLAGLFPPDKLLIWKSDLKWQPIPYNFLPRKDDNLMLAILADKYIEKYNEYCNSKEAKDVMKTVEPILSYIRNYSGSPATTPRDFFFLYITLITEDHNGLKLPQWTKAIYPHPLEDLIHLEFEVEMATKELRRNLIGELIKKILKDTDNRIAGKSNHKIHLYSGHDVNIVYILKILGLMYRHAPGYASCVALEVHEENGYFIKVFYKNDKYTDFKLMQFPNGRSMMYLEDFRNLVDALYEETEYARGLILSGVPITFEEQTTYLLIGLICSIYFI